MNQISQPSGLLSINQAHLREEQQHHRPLYDQVDCQQHHHLNDPAVHCKIKGEKGETETELNMSPQTDRVDVGLVQNSPLIGGMS